MKLEPRYKKIFREFYEKGKLQGAQIKSLSNSNYANRSKEIISEQRRLENNSRNYISNLEQKSVCS